MVDISPADAERLLTAFDASQYYVPPIEVVRAEAALASHGHFNLFHRERALRADIYVAGADSLARWALQRRRTLPIAGESIWIAPLEYVILMKLEYYRQSGSERHLRDVAAILRQSGDIVDDAVMTEWTQRLQLTHEWDLGRDRERR